MASLVLSTVGGALGGAIGGPIGGVLGQAGGALAGGVLGLSGAGSGGASPIIVRTTVGPRLTALNGISSTEGAPVARVYGRARVGGQMIWATRFLEQVNYSYEPSIGGKGGSDPAPTPQLTIRVSVTYSYSASFAIGLCEGPIAFVRRVWADGQEIDLTTITMRVYDGTEDQLADPLIAAVEEPGTVPAYRGLAYVVFEWLPIGPYGNRIPQLSFEVVRPVQGIGAMIRAVNLIPGGTEFGYDPSVHISIPGPGTTVAENRNQYFAGTDWEGSLDALQALCPNLRSVALIVVWFGDDLRAGHCTIAPRVDNYFKTLTYPAIPQSIDDWSVAGVARSGAQRTSFVDGAAAFGGTPSDASVVAAIADLKARGLSVVFYPFLMMDVPPDNGRPDPWTGEPSQPAFPWRGRITCDTAPGTANSPDGTAAAGAQVDAFFGDARYRGFILHCAALAGEAGGVDGFLVGSELVGLTRVRSAPGVYPAVTALAALAADVKALLGPGTKVYTGRTGPNTARTSWRAARKCASRSMPSGRRPPWILSASTRIGHSATGATARISMRRSPTRCSTWPTSTGASRRAKPSTASTPMTRRVRRRGAARSPTARMASRGCSGRKTSRAGGPTRTSSVSPASRRARPPGRPAPSRSG